MKNLILRGITGTAFVAAIVAALTVHPYAFLCLFATVVGLALWEFYGLTEHMDRAPSDAAAPPAPRTADRLWGIAAGMYLFTATFLYASGRWGIIVYMPYFVFLIASLVSGLYHRGGNPITRWAMGLLAQAYVAGSFALLNFIVFRPDAPTFHSHYALLLFVLIWLNDTGAYAVGSTLGRHRLFPRISPGKSWEGFVGGLVIVWIAALLLAPFFPELAWYHRLMLATVIVSFGTWGDLVESLIKRSCGAKDSGSLLPGHGGILDRFDSVMLATPAALLYLEMVRCMG